jgi:16S rRNA (guanine966-N2)-methyltransferase
VRILGGILGGRTIDVPKGLQLRPTTAFAGEALFNILSNKIDFDSVSLLDLFSGTGHISIEFASRGCKEIVSVDSSFNCVNFIKQTASKFSLPINSIKGDAFKYLKENKRKFDIIFADPPYDLPNIEEIHQLVFENELLNKDGLLIIEHGPRTKMEHLTHFDQHRKYGNVNFSFFSQK